MFRRFLILFFHEVRSHLVSPATYVAATLFLAMLGAIHWMALWDAARESQDWLPSENLFRLHWVPALFFVPMLTMRAFAEERRLGTLGALLSTPVGPHTVTMAKFAASYLLYLVFWAGAMAFPWLAWGLLGKLQPDPRLLGATSLMGGMVFIASSAPLYVAVGLLCSALTRSVQVAGMTAFVAILVLIAANKGLFWLSDTYTGLEWLRSSAEVLNAAKYAEEFARGVVDTRPLLHFGSGALLALGATALVIESKA